MKIILLNSDNFYSQRNNLNKPNETCNVTSAINFMTASKLKFFTEEGKQPEDTMYDFLQTPLANYYAKMNIPWYYKKSPNTLQNNIAMLSWAINIFAMNGSNKPVCKYEQSTVDIATLDIKHNKPVLILGDFYKGNKNSHYVTLIGIDGEDLILADPYGDYRTNYTNYYGYGIKISKKDLDKIWSDKYCIRLI